MNEIFLCKNIYITQRTENRLFKSIASSLKSIAISSNWLEVYILYLHQLIILQVKIFPVHSIVGMLWNDRLPAPAPPLSPTQEIFRVQENPCLLQLIKPPRINILTRKNVSSATIVLISFWFV